MIIIHRLVLHSHLMINLSNMDLKQKIEEYVAKNGDSFNHTFSDGSKVVGQKLSVFLIKWYNQAVEEWKNYKTNNNAKTIEKLIK